MIYQKYTQHPTQRQLSAAIGMLMSVDSRFITH